MSIVGDSPEKGLRIEVERPAAAVGAPWRYEGDAVTPTARFRIVAVVEANGAVVVDVAAGAPAEVTDRIRRVLRAAWKHAQDDGLPPPRRVVRWRGET
jgi:hypothetical protein